MKKIFTLLIAVLLFAPFSLKADNWTETFDDNHATSYGTEFTCTISGTWSANAAGNFSYANQNMGSYAVTINDDNAGAHITTPVLNTCGTVSFKYAYVNGSETNVFILQKSTDGTTFTDLDTHTLGASANGNYVDYSFDVEESSSTVYLRVLSDDQDAHLFIEDFTVTDFGTVIVDANLSDLLVDGSTISGFSSNNINYTVELPAGTTTVPTVTYTTSDGAATAVVTDATDLTGDAAARTTTVVVTGTDGTTTKTYSILFNPIIEVATLGDLRAAFDETRTFKVTGEILLSFQQDYRNKKYVQDGTGGIEIDDNAGVITTTYAIGDGITGLEGTLTDYNGLMQFVPSADPGAATSSANALVPIVVTPAQLNADIDAYEGQLVIVEDVTIDEADGSATFANGNNYTMTGEVESAVLRVNFYNTTLTGEVIPDSANVTGIVLEYNGTGQVAPRSADDVEELLPPLPSEATLSDLLVDGVTIDGFDPSVISYEMNLGAGATIPVVTATTADVNATLVITDATDLSGDVAARTATVVVTAQDGSTSLTYSIVFSTVVEVATLGELRAAFDETSTFRITGEVLLSFQQDYRNKKYVQDATGGIEIDDEPGIITSTYAIGDGISGLEGTLEDRNGLLQLHPTMDPGAASSTGNTIDPIVVTPAEINADIDAYESQLVIINSGTIDEADGTATFANGSNYTLNGETESMVLRVHFYSTSLTGEVIPDSANVTGIVLEYSGTAQVAPRSADDVEELIEELPSEATLSDLLVDGTTVEGFVSSKIDYVVDLPAGASVPVVTYTTADANATAVVTDATDLSGDAAARTTSVVVTAQDGSTSLTYTILFNPVVEVANLGELRTMSDFTRTYKITGEVLLSFQQDYRNKKYVQDATGGIEIDDDPGIITSTYAIGDGISGLEGTLEDRNGLLQLHPTMDPGAASSTGNTIDPIVATPAEINADIDAYESQLVIINSGTIDEADGTAVFENGSNYTLNGVAESMVLRVHFYSTSLTGEVIPDSLNVIGIVIEYNGTAQIAPRSADDVEALEEYIPSDDANLSGITVDGTALAGFSPATLTYYVTLPVGTTTVPTVAATTSDDNASAVVTDATDLEGDAAARTTSIVVTAEDGTTVKTYSIEFTVEVSVDNKMFDAISVYPVPANSKLNITHGHLIDQVSIYNITGARVMQVRNIENELITIDVTSLDQGVYLIKIEGSEASTVRRVVKQ